MRRASDMKRSMMIALALLTLSLLPAWAMYGKGPDSSPTWSSFRRPAQPVAAPAPVTAPRQIAPVAVTGPFLPVILTSTRVTPIVFTGSATSDCIGTTGTSFTYGIKYLCVDLSVDGAQGQQYRFSWTKDGEPQPAADTTGTISAQLVLVPAGICFLQQNGECGAIIARGTYQVSFFLNNVQYQTNTAFIR